MNPIISWVQVFLDNKILSFQGQVKNVFL